MTSKFLDDLSREIRDFSSMENNWPKDWTVDEIDKRIEEHKDIIRKAEERGLRKIGGGGYRVAFEIKDSNSLGLPSGNVIKFSKTDGTMQNKHALQAYRNLSSEARKHVASIRIDVSHDRFIWIVQNKGGTAKPRDAGIVRERLAEHDVYVSDLRSENCCRIDGDPVLADLGLLYEKI